MSKKLIDAIVHINEELAIEITEEMLRNGEDPLNIMKYYGQAMDIIGEKFSSGEYYLAELVMGGEIFEEAKNIVLPQIENSNSKEEDMIVLGTVEGDIHNIGKDIFKAMAESSGFKVIDLGVDVSPQKFVEVIEKTDTSIVGLSCLLTSAIDTMKNTIETVKEAGFNDVKFLIGGSPVDETTGSYTGSDAYAEDALDGVSILKSWAESFEK